VKNFILKRFIRLILVGAGVASLVGILIHFIPGDPVDLMAGPYASLEDKIALRKSLGLDKSIFEQVFYYLKSILQLDLGTSITYDQNVSSLIFERIIPTFELAFFSILTALFISIPLGFLSAAKSNTFWDTSSSFIALLGVSIPNFWLGPILVLVFAINFDLLPVSERGDWRSYILPCITLGSSLAGILTRMIRTSLLENLQEDYIRTARAKGVAPFRLWFIHLFKNASLPVVTILGLQFGVLLTGSIITEKIFDWPGTGTLLIDAISARDYPLVQGCVLFFSSIYVFVNFSTDLIYMLIDPRVSLKNHE